ncbi:MAG TPA: LysM peptidoglycan-binding domain-containing protein [Candidatus Copromonas avistercoris]|nr:LysM peptidoglycan-binding domain-containing protein [Candidatus Copromonas avistercoris]
MGDLYNPFPKLPKNVRQIGDPDQVVRLYVEDYVNTYLKRLYPSGRQTMRVGVLLGSVEQYDGTPYIFIDGAMELEDVETEGEKILFSESSWKKLYSAMETAFPKRTVQGWFLCGGPSSQLSPLNYWKQHSQYFAGKNQLMYLNHGLEGEEAVYVTSEDGFYRLKGHYIYYERNQMMQDYMISRKDVRRVESGSHEKVIKDFRQRMTARKEQAGARQRTAGVLGMACGILSVAVLAGGVVLMNNYQKMRQMEGVLASVLPVGVSDWQEYQEELEEAPDFIIEERPGNVYPTAGTEDGSQAANGQAADDQTAGSQIIDGQAAGGQAVNGQAAVGQDNLGTGAETGTEAGAGAGQGTEEGAGMGAGSGAETGTTPSPETMSSEDAFSSGQASQAPLDNLVGMGKESEPEKQEEGLGEGDAKENVLPPVDYDAAEANGYRIYEIGEGETLYGICWKEYGDLSRLEEICRLNALEDVDHILAGQRLILP